MPFRIQKENSDAKGESESFGFSTKNISNAHLCYSAKKNEKLYLFMGPADKKSK